MIRLITSLNTNVKVYSVEERLLISALSNLLRWKDNIFVLLLKTGKLNRKMDLINRAYEFEVEEPALIKQAYQKLMI